MSRVISIAGAKGSPGCSFLAVALARHLADNQVSTLLLDADAEGGGLAALLDIGPAGTINGSPVDEPAMQVDQNLWFAEIGQPVAEVLNGLEWMGSARTEHEVVIVDLGHSAGTLQRQLSAAADWLLWVVVPDRSGLQRADATLASGRLGSASVGLIFNRLRRGCLEGAEEVLAGRHQLPVLGRFAEDRHISQRMTRGQPVHRVWSLRRPLRGLANSVHPGTGSALSSWR
jgi:MinD-like ATPase involved in chromosome partitioning or flagellar assembly